MVREQQSMEEENTDRGSCGVRWGTLHLLWPSLTVQETQVPRAMRSLATTVRTEAESTKGIKTWMS